MKAFKRKEILDKIEQLRKITGNDELAFKDEDLEEDFDPDKYDQRMAEVFEQYDNAPFQPEDEEKPVFQTWILIWSRIIGMNMEMTKMNKKIKKVFFTLFEKSNFCPKIQF